MPVPIPASLARQNGMITFDISSHLPSSVRPSKRAYRASSVPGNARGGIRENCSLMILDAPRDSSVIWSILLGFEPERS